MLDGRPVRSRAQWVNERRPELQALFQYYMYGAIPPKPAHLQTRLVGQYRDFLGGKATLKVLVLETGPGNAPRIDLILVVPNQRSGPAPVFLAMNFCGNHALTTDPRVPLNKSWLGNSCQGCTNNHATEAARGSQAANWPLDRIVECGYGLASFCSGDIDSDRGNVSDGIYAWLANGDSARNNPTNRGTLAAWAWGFHRCVDYLVTDRDVDAHRIASVGHSRNGKTALLAAAGSESPFRTKPVAAALLQAEAKSANRSKRSTTTFHTGSTVSSKSSTMRPSACHLTNIVWWHSALRDPFSFRLPKRISGRIPRGNSKCCEPPIKSIVFSV